MAAPASHLIIFDCDGVLVDSEPISFSVLRDTLANAGVNVSESRAYQQFLGKSMATITRLIADEFSISLGQEHIEAMRRELFARFQAELQPIRGIRELLENSPYTRCVASSSQPERIRLSLKKTGLIDFFEPNIFSATMVSKGKPAPDLFLHAAQSMGFAPSQCIVIEDSPAGIKAAHAAGMHVFAFTGGSHAEISNLREMVVSLEPAAIFDDMTALPGLIDTLRA
ncbi:HAD family hydrolase [Rhizobium sp. KVB221]|uniref:HAD family hydrolase n=1 Tax=Rhizobium setariae TaxID=2801340 RepID=A0A936YTT6_9HYPH|nr:HAD family hydrolase [Rhizobium setariae]MBL0372687.1 HAD family hydrolase [Rhizobium setariae]